MVWLKSINSASTLQNYPIVKDIESIYCRLVYTRQQTFIPLVEARNEQFLCPYKTHCFALCQCCDFDACDCEMTCPDGCNCYHDNYPWWVYTQRRILKAVDLGSCSSFGNSTWVAGASSRLINLALALQRSILDPLVDVQPFCHQPQASIEWVKPT